MSMDFLQPTTLNNETKDRLKTRERRRAQLVGNPRGHANFGQQATQFGQLRANSDNLRLGMRRAGRAPLEVGDDPEMSDARPADNVPSDASVGPRPVNPTSHEP